MNSVNIFFSVAFFLFLNSWNYRPAVVSLFIILITTVQWISSEWLWIFNIQYITVSLSFSISIHRHSLVFTFYAIAASEIELSFFFLLSLYHIIIIFIIIVIVPSHTACETLNENKIQTEYFSKNCAWWSQLKISKRFNNWHDDI